MKLPAYPRTKPSGVEWLGDVPGHWAVKRLKYSASINDEALPETTSPDFEFEYVDIGGVSAVDGITATEQVVFENAPSRARRKVRHGDTIVSTVRTYLRAIAPIKNPPENLIVSTGFAVVRPRKVESSFLAYALRESSFVESVVARSVGVSYPAVNASEVGGIAIPLPDPAEQQAIAAFLDRETGRVDRLVAKKRELIERLKEKRTALISRTVTRGLPPAAARAAGLPANPPLKPSTLDWLGDIPAHWEVRKFSRCAFYQEGPGLRNWQFTQDGIRVICVTNITEAGISFSNYEKFISEDEYQSTYRHFTVAKGDLLLSSSGNSWGKVATFDADDVAILNTSTIRVNENGSRTVIRPLIGWLLISEGTREQLGLFMTGSCQPNFGPSHLARVWICVPPLPEQAAIAAYLDEETAKLDALVGKVEEAVERLQEYRTALITAAVTGKIDVRGSVDVRPGKKVTSASP